nr:serine/threonine-protein kinase PknK [Acidobacteriota bacterium]
PSLLSAALEQGNLFAATDLRTRLNVIWLVADDPHTARAEVIEALKTWPHEGFHLQHYTSLYALAQIELYTGDVEVAFRHIDGQWKALEDSMLLRTQVLRIEATHLLARTALASGMISGNKNRFRIAEKLAARIGKEKMSPWAKPLANLVRAAVAHQRGETVQATTLLSEAIQGFDRSDMALYAAVSRWRLGELIGDDKGRQLVTEANAWMASQMIKNPESMTRILAPGF